MVFSSPWAVLQNSTQLLLIFKFSFITFGRRPMVFYFIMVAKKVIQSFREKLDKEWLVHFETIEIVGKNSQDKNPFGHTDICIEELLST